MSFFILFSVVISLRVMSGRPDAGILRLLFFLSDRHWQMSLFEPSVIFVCTFVLMHCTVFFLQCRLFLQQVRVCSNAQDVRVRVGSLHSQIAKASGAFFTQMLYFLQYVAVRYYHTGKWA